MADDTDYLSAAFRNDGDDPFEVVDKPQSSNPLHDAAPDLLAACKAWLRYFDQLEADSEPGDPLAEARLLYHGKRIAMTRAAVAKAEGCG